MSENTLKFQALQLFDTFVELPERDRELRLRALIQQAPELAQEVQRLLAADAVVSGVLDHGVVKVAQTLVTALHVDEGVSGLHPGAQVGADQPGVQGPLGSHQAQDHLPGAVR